MVGDKKVVVVLPAYNAEKTLRQTFDEIPGDVVDAVLLVDDASTDKTVEVAGELGIEYIRHEKNLGYGGNQKTCYRAALERGADIVAMLHPDYQYTPRLLGAMAHLINSAHYDVVLGSRILGGRALAGGMPRLKYVSNRLLTFAQNLLLGAKLSEYHTGYRAYTREVLESIPWEDNSDDFLFDNQMLSQIIYHGFTVGEITCPAKYFAEASSIGLFKSAEYGIGCLITAVEFRLNKLGLASSKLFRGANKTQTER